MKGDESATEQRDRLKSLAQKRVSQFLAGDTVLPHSTSEGDVAFAEEGLALTTHLLKTGHASTQLDSYAFVIEELKGYRNAIHNIFSIKVNGVPLETLLQWFGEPDRHRFVLQPFGELEKQMRGHSGCVADISVSSDVCALLYFTFLDAHNKHWFSDYMAPLQREQEAQRLAKEEMFQALGTIVQVEADHFQKVLLRKYKQLVYVDEYETADESRFIDELKRFASKRMPDIDQDFIVNKVHAIVLSWLAEEPRSSTDLSFHSDMTPREYERYCSDILATAGWSTQLTPVSGDQGADVICEASGIRLVVQCKLYSSPVGNGAVQEVIAAKQFEYADVAVVVSSAAFTRSAKELANVSGVLLLHHEQLHTLYPGTFTRSDKETK